MVRAAYAAVYESIARIEIRPQESANIGIEQLIEQKEEGRRRAICKRKWRFCRAIR